VYENFILLSLQSLVFLQFIYIGLGLDQQTLKKLLYRKSEK